MSERVPSNHEFAQSLGRLGWHFHGWKAIRQRSDFVPFRNARDESLDCVFDVVARRVDMALRLADAQVPGVTVSGGR